MYTCWRTVWFTSLASRVGSHARKLLLHRLCSSITIKHQQLVSSYRSSSTSPRTKQHFFSSVNFSSPPTHLKWFLVSYPTAFLLPLAPRREQWGDAHAVSTVVRCWFLIRRRALSCCLQHLRFLLVRMTQVPTSHAAE